MLLTLVCLTMGFHVWIVCKTLAILNDVTDIMVVNHGNRMVKSWPDVTTYILDWDKQLEKDKNLYSCCSSPNCIVTTNQYYVGKDYTTFDALLFSEWFLESMNKPEKKSNTLNIFTSATPSHKKLVCDEFYDHFFNLTFTYRLDSDIVFKYFAVCNFSGEIIAPNINPSWKISPKPVSTKLKSVIKRKKEAIAYVEINNKSWKRSYLSKLEPHLSKYSLKIKEYNSSNNCGNNRCYVKLRYEYYFCIIFEDILAEDYLTKKILYAYDNYVVPIIISGANYSRFLPPNSYVDGGSNPRDIAQTIHKSVNNITEYENYFKWRNIYKIESYQPFCDLCEAINKLIKAPAKENFREWWNGKDRMQLCSIKKIKNETI